MIPKRHQKGRLVEVKSLMRKAICQRNYCFRGKNAVVMLVNLLKQLIEIEKCLVNNDDAKKKNYEKRLEETISKIRNVTTKVNLVFKNCKESGQMLEFCKFREEI